MILLVGFLHLAITATQIACSCAHSWKSLHAYFFRNKRFVCLILLDTRVYCYVMLVMMIYSVQCQPLNIVQNLIRLPLVNPHEWSKVIWWTGRNRFVLKLLKFPGIVSSCMLDTTHYNEWCRNIYVLPGYKLPGWKLKLSVPLIFFFSDAKMTIANYVQCMPMYNCPCITWWITSQYVLSSIDFIPCIWGKQHAFIFVTNVDWQPLLQKNWSLRRTENWLKMNMVTLLLFSFRCVS